MNSLSSRHLRYDFAMQWTVEYLNNILIFFSKRSKLIWVIVVYARSPSRTFAPIFPLNKPGTMSSLWCKLMKR